MNTAEPKVRAVLASVGGTPDPLLKVLRHYQPEHVWFFCSPDSRATAEAVHALLEWRPLARYIEVERYEELGPCYRELRRRIPEILREARVLPEEVLVDYTGGTKTMSAALVLAGIESFHRFGYVGGHQRDRQGLGAVIPGTEKRVEQCNPWHELAVRELEKVKELWDHHLFEPAADILEQTAPKVPKRRRFEAFASLARGLAARHRLDFSNANSHLHTALGRLEPVYEGQEDHGLIAWARLCKEICEACTEPANEELLLRELLDNALRTASQCRYEDAAARLYRAMELQGQIWLKTATGGLIVHGHCSAGEWSRLPEPLKAQPFCQPGEDGNVKLSLEQVFRALAVLDHPQARVVVADLDQGRKSRWRTATEKRNAGILAHGVKPVGKDGFEEMKALASEFLGFDLQKEANPIPAFRLEWLE
jgi:CRISPR-associated protein (TIGR02710 family)